MRARLGRCIPQPRRRRKRVLRGDQSRVYIAPYNLWLSRARLARLTVGQTIRFSPGLSKVQWELRIYREINIFFTFVISQQKRIGRNPRYPARYLFLFLSCGTLVKCVTLWADTHLRCATPGRTYIWNTHLLDGNTKIKSFFTNSCNDKHNAFLRMTWFCLAMSCGSGLRMNGELAPGKDN